MRVHTGDKPPKKQNTNNPNNGQYERVRYLIILLIKLSLCYYFIYMQYCYCNLSVEISKEILKLSTFQKSFLYIRFSSHEFLRYTSLIIYKLRIKSDTK